MNNWLFKDENEISEAKVAFDSLGFCGFSNLLDNDELSLLLNAVDKSINEKKIEIHESTLLANNDVVFADQQFEQTCRNPRLVNVAKTLINCDAIELQHSKLNAKPKRDQGEGEVKWHQDYPFFPHTNYDLIACAIHLDDESSESGPMEFIPGSHHLGVLSHLYSDGKFAYKCTEESVFNSDQAEILVAKKGWVTFHHCLTLHRSAPKTTSANRSLLVYQYRATDAVQLAGVIWRCNGYKVHEIDDNRRYARFSDGKRVELRGIDGRLYDTFSRLTPDK